jgi:hypothetical protein
MSSFNLSRAISRWRFSLSGLLLLMLSISVGLAMWRLPGATGAQFLYGCFGSWFVVGMIQRSRRTWKLLPSLNPLDPSLRMGLRVAIVGPTAIAMLLVCGVVMNAATRIDWFGLNAELDDYEQLGSWILHRLTWTDFFLAIVGGYWNGDPVASWPTEPASAAAMRRGVGVAAGGLLLALLVINTAAIMAMVHEGVEGVVNYQPTRWAGHNFDPWLAKPVQVQREFILGGMLSMTMLVGALGAVFVMAQRWNSSQRYRLLLAAIAISLLTTVVGMLAWCAAVALPVMSPILAQTLPQQPRINLVVALVLIVYFAAIVSLFVTAKVSDQPVRAGSGGSATARFAHERWEVLLLGLAAMVWQLCTGLANQRARWEWYRWADLSYDLPEPEHLLWLAAFIMMASALRQACRDGPSPRWFIWAVEPGKFLATWALFASALVLVPPVGAWFGLALMLQPGMP